MKLVHIEFYRTEKNCFGLKVTTDSSLKKLGRTMKYLSQDSVDRDFRASSLAVSRVYVTFTVPVPLLSLRIVHGVRH